MNNAILHLVVLSVVSGAVISIIPEGGVKSITTILSTLILISSIIGYIGKPGLQEYALKAADVDNIEQEFKLSTVENAAALKHIYLENQCIEYILDKAKECNIIVHEVDIEIKFTEVEQIAQCDIVDIFASVLSNHIDRI